MRVLKKTGLAQIAIGCEAATNEQLETVKKGENIEDIETALKLIHEQGIEIQGYWIIGLPSDTREKIKKTQAMILDYIRKGYNTIPHITILVPYPGSPIAKQPRGIKINSKKWKDYWMNCDAYGCGEPVYDTIDSNGKTLLTSKEIYDLWLETLQMVTTELKNRRQKNENQQS